VVEWEALQRTLSVEGGVVDHGVEITGRRQGPGDRGVVGHIERQPEGHVEVVEQLGVSGRRHDLVAGSGQFGGRGRADGPSCAGDENSHGAEVRHEPAGVIARRRCDRPSADRPCRSPALACRDDH
jgi:hypothetical protein